MSSEDFTRMLVKGRIAETVFAQMLRSTGKFTVLKFGYEKIIPELVGFGQDVDDNAGVLDTLRSAPDFAVINRETKEVRLIEVKYRTRLHKPEILARAQKMHESWNPSYLFVATQDKFYFDEISTIIANNGNISELKHVFLPQDLQDKYIQIIKDFETVA